MAVDTYEFPGVTPVCSPPLWRVLLFQGLFSNFSGANHFCRKRRRCHFSVILGSRGETRFNQAGIRHDQFKEGA